jgi:hypothetical protein
MTDEKHADIEDENTYVLDGEKFRLFSETVSEIIDEDGIKKTVIIKFVKPNMYEKQKKFIKKYMENNKESINEYNKALYKKRYENDPEFRGGYQRRIFGI